MPRLVHAYFSVPASSIGEVMLAPLGAQRFSKSKFTQYKYSLLSGYWSVHSSASVRVSPPCVINHVVWSDNMPRCILDFSRTLITPAKSIDTGRHLKGKMLWYSSVTFRQGTHFLKQLLIIYSIMASLHLKQSITECFTFQSNSASPFLWLTFCCLFSILFAVNVFHYCPLVTRNYLFSQGQTWLPTMLTTASPIGPSPRGAPARAAETKKRNVWTSCGTSPTTHA